MEKVKQALESALKMVDELGCAKDASGRKQIVEAIESLNTGHCCNLKCTENAKFDVHYKGEFRPDTSTQCCEKHLSEFMSDKHINEVELINS